MFDWDIKFKWKMNWIMEISYSANGHRQYTYNNISFCISGYSKFNPKGMPCCTMNDSINPLTVFNGPGNQLSIRTWKLKGAHWSMINVDGPWSLINSFRKYKFIWNSWRSFSHPIHWWQSNFSINVHLFKANLIENEIRSEAIQFKNKRKNHPSITHQCHNSNINGIFIGNFDIGPVSIWCAFPVFFIHRSALCHSFMSQKKFRYLKHKFEIRSAFYFR